MVFWKLKLCCPRIRVEWFNTFWNFQKRYIPADQVFFMSPIPKQSAYSAGRKVYIFKQSQEPLKQIFLKLYRYLPNTSKNKRQNRKFEIKCLFNILYFIPKLAKTVFDLNNSKQNFFELLLIFSFWKIKEYILPLFQVSKKFWKFCCCCF